MSESSTGEAASTLRTLFQGQLINIRSGSGFEYPIVYRVPGGTDLGVTCYTFDTGGNRWYQLMDGNFVLAAAFTPAGWYLPECGGGAIGSPPRVN